MPPDRDADIAFAAGLLDGSATGANVDYYAAIVREKAQRRAIMQQAIDLARACTNGHDTTELVAAGAGLFRQAMAADPEARKRIISSGALFEELSVQSKLDRGRKIRTNLPSLDSAFSGGVYPGEVLTFVARPQVGKSAVAVQIALDAARSNERVVFFSLEMPRQQCLTRLLQNAWGVSDAAVEIFAQDRWQTLTSLMKAQKMVIEERIVVVDRGKSGIEHLDSAMQEAEALLDGPPRLAIIDYLGLLSSGARNISLYQRVSEAALDVKTFAKRHNVAVVLLSQAGRDQDVERSEGAGRLTIDAARDSGQVEEAADFMVTLWRPELASKLSPLAKHDVIGRLDGAIVKNRRGRCSGFSLHIDPTSTRLTELGDPS